MNSRAVSIDEYAVNIAGGWLVGHDQRILNFRSLLYLIHKIKPHLKNKKLIISFPDGDPIRLVNYDHVLKIIAETLLITKENFIVEIGDRSFKSHYATVRYRYSNDTSLRIIDHLKDHTKDLVLKENPALFGLIYGRYSSERFMLAHYAATDLQDHCFVIFHPRYSYVESELAVFSEFFEDELNWLKSWQNPNATIPSNVPGDTSGPTGQARQNSDYAKLYPNFRIEIVVETDVHNKWWLSEKTYKCLYTGKPFLLLCEAGTLELLREVGFKTFDGIFDESYDREPNVYRRIEMIQSEMQRLASMPQDEQQKVFQSLEPIVHHNKLNYRESVTNFLKLVKNDILN